MQSGTRSKRLRSSSPESDNSTFIAPGHGKRLCDDSRGGLLTTRTRHDMTSPGIPTVSRKGVKQRVPRSGKPPPRYSLGLSNQIFDGNRKELPDQGIIAVDRDIEMEGNDSQVLLADQPAAHTRVAIPTQTQIHPSKGNGLPYIVQAAASSSRLMESIGNGAQGPRTTNVVHVGSNNIHSLAVSSNSRVVSDTSVDDSAVGIWPALAAHAPFTMAPATSLLQSSSIDSLATSSRSDVVSDASMDNQAMGGALRKHSNQRTMTGQVPTFSLHDRPNVSRTLPPAPLAVSSPPPGLGSNWMIPQSPSIDSLATSSKSDVISDSSMDSDGGPLEANIDQENTEGQAPTFSLRDHLPDVALPLPSSPLAVSFPPPGLGSNWMIPQSPSIDSLATSSKSDVISDSSMDSDGGPLEANIDQEDTEGQAPTFSLRDRLPDVALPLPSSPFVVNSHPHGLGSNRMITQSPSIDSLATSSKSDVISDSPMDSDGGPLEANIDQENTEGQAPTFSLRDRLPDVALPLPSSPFVVNPHPPGLGSNWMIPQSPSIDSLATSSKSDVISDSSMDSDGGPLEANIDQGNTGGQAPTFSLRDRLPDVALPLPSSPFVVNPHPPGPGSNRIITQSPSIDSLATSSKSDVISDTSMGGQVTGNESQAHLGQQPMEGQMSTIGLRGHSPNVSFTLPPAGSSVSSPTPWLGPNRMTQQSRSVDSLAMSSKSDVLSDGSVDAPLETHLGRGLLKGQVSTFHTRSDLSAVDFIPPQLGINGYARISDGQTIDLPQGDHLRRLSWTSPAPVLRQSDTLDSLALTSYSDVISEVSVDYLAEDLGAVRIDQNPVDRNAVAVHLPLVSTPAPPRSLMLNNRTASSRSEILSDASMDEGDMAVARHPYKSQTSQHNLRGNTGTPIDATPVSTARPPHGSAHDQRQVGQQHYVQHWVTTLPAPSEPRVTVAGHFGRAPLHRYPVQKVIDPISVSQISGSANTNDNSDIFTSGREDAQSEIRRSLWRHRTLCPTSRPSDEGSTSIHVSSSRTAIYSDEIGLSSDSAALEHLMAVDLDEARPEGGGNGLEDTNGISKNKSGAPNKSLHKRDANRRPPRGQSLAHDSDDDLVSLNRTDSVVTMDVDAVTDEDDDDSIHHSPMSQNLVLSDEPESGTGSLISGTRELNAVSLGPLSSKASTLGSLAVSDAQVPHFRQIYRDLLKRREEVIRCGDLANILKVVSRHPGTRRKRTSRSSSSGTTSTSSISISSRPRLRSQALGNVKKRNITRPRNPTRVAIARDVRAHTLVLMGREKNSSPITSVVQSRIDRWVTSDKQERYGPNADNFQLFLDFKHISTDMRPHCNAWNNQAKEVFVDDFLAAYPELRSHRDTALNCFAVHLKQLQNQFSRLHSATDEAMSAVAVKARKEQLRRSRCGRRLKTMSIFLKGKGRDMERLVKVAHDTLDWRCCSGDETDEDGDHVITALPWRSEGLTELFRYVDLLALCLRFPDGVHATSGRFPLHRYDPTDKNPQSERMEDPHRSTPIPGLPENFYDPAWLQRNQNLDKKNAVSLRLPSDLIRLAQTALPIRNRYTLPFERPHDI